MRMNRECQIAILICLYLQRSGRALFVDILAGLGIKFTADLSVLMSRLLTGNIVNYDINGYALMSDPTVGDILSTLEEQHAEISGLSMEHRALSNYLRSTRQALKPILNRKISNINKELIANEVALRERANEEGLEN